MKDLTTLQKELETREDFQIKSFDFIGGIGVFIRGPKRGMTVVWSNDGGWEHVSLDGKKRTPEWDEMCEIKDMFFKPDEWCVQFHPAKDDYVNISPHCLHIWRPVEKFTGPMPLPRPQSRKDGKN